MEKKLKLPCLSGLASFVFVTSLCLGAYALERSPFIPFIINYSIAFGAFWWLTAKGNLSFNQMFVLAVFIRLLILFSMPLLSQDYFRFIWDGTLMNLGENPYAFTPNEILENQLFLLPNQEALINGMGTLSAQHYSNYPPVNQLLFFVATFLGGNSIFWSVVWMRVFILAFEIGIIWVGKKLLCNLAMPSVSIFWYALNPLIILELNANLHVESIMLFFFLLSCYLLKKQRILLGAFIFALSVLTKLFTFYLFPFLVFFFASTKEETLISRFFHKKYILFLLVSLSVIVLSFFAFGLYDYKDNYMASVGLWFGTFEFNASVYYVLRWIGYQWVGWNTIAVNTKILLVLLFIGYVLLLWRTRLKSTSFLLEQMMWAVVFYFVMATTLHPWYLATPLLFSVFTRYKFMLVWSFFVMFSYAAYASVKVDESTLLLLLQYGIVGGFLLKEVIFFKQQQTT